MLPTHTVAPLPPRLETGADATDDEVNDAANVTDDKCIPEVAVEDDDGADDDDDDDDDDVVYEEDEVTKSNTRASGLVCTFTD